MRDTGYDTGSRMQKAIRMVEGGMSKSAAARAAGVDRSNLIKAWKKHEQVMGYQTCPCCDAKVLRLALPEKVVDQIRVVRERYEEGTL